MYSKSLKIVCLFMMSFIGQSLWAYPIFFKCGENAEISNQFSLEDSNRLVADKNLGENNINCDSLQECLDQFRQTLILTQGSIEMAKAVYGEKKSSIMKLSDEELKSLSQTAKTMTQIKQCHEAQQEHLDKNKLTLYYPHETLYQYVTGYRKNNFNDYGQFTKPDKNVVYQIIEESIKVGVDPLAILGMAMMERAGGELHRYGGNMHDKRSQNILGCPIGKFDKNDKGEELPYLARNSDQFTQIAGKLNYSKSSSDRYTCVGRADDKKYIDDTKGFSNYSSLENAKENGKTCCIKSKYNLSNESARTMTTFLYFKQMQEYDAKHPLMGRYNPRTIESRLNTFLGMSSTVGTYPSFRVSPVRVGVNSYEDPNYGRQIMDYILNSFMRNGNIMQHIEKTSKKYNTPVKSFLCVGKKAGSYMLDSDYYFEQFKQTERMLKIKKEYDKGKSWKNLKIGYQSVLLQEFTAKGTGVYPNLKKYLSKEEMKELDKYADHLYTHRNVSLRREGRDPGPLPSAGNKIFQKVYDLYFTKKEFYPTRKTLVNAARQDENLSWKRSTDDQMQEIATHVNALSEYDLQRLESSKQNWLEQLMESGLPEIQNIVTDEAKQLMDSKCAPEFEAYLLGSKNDLKNCYAANYQITLKERTDIQKNYDFSDETNLDLVPSMMAKVNLAAKEIYAQGLIDRAKDYAEYRKNKVRQSIGQQLADNSEKKKIKRKIYKNMTPAEFCSEYYKIDLTDFGLVSYGDRFQASCIAEQSQRKTRKFFNKKTYQRVFELN